ncbi:aldehyde dehydrogenase family protein, partial [Mesorhizobium sp. M2A.F.Ca.ET.042.01.1.1]
MCTLRRGRHLPRRNTHYQAGATPYPGRTCTGWNSPAWPGAPHLVCRARPDNADFDVVADTAANSASLSTGQRCIALSRLIITEGLRARSRSRQVLN